jgi:hypothetical protein
MVAYRDASGVRKDAIVFIFISAVPFAQGVAVLSFAAIFRDLDVLLNGVAYPGYRDGASIIQVVYRRLKSPQLVDRRLISSELIDRGLYTAELVDRRVIWSAKPGNRVYRLPLIRKRLPVSGIRNGIIRHLLCPYRYFVGIKMLIHSLGRIRASIFRLRVGLFYGRLGRQLGKLRGSRRLGLFYVIAAGGILTIVSPPPAAASSIIRLAYECEIDSQLLAALVGFPALSRGAAFV